MISIAFSDDTFRIKRMWSHRLELPFSPRAPTWDPIFNKEGITTALKWLLIHVSGNSRLLASTKKAKQEAHGTLFPGTWMPHSNLLQQIHKVRQKLVTHHAQSNNLQSFSLYLIFFSHLWEFCNLAKILKYFYERERAFSSTSSLPKCLQWLEVEDRNHELNQGLPYWWQGSKYLRAMHHCCPPGPASAESKNWDSEPAPWYGYRYAKRHLNY